MKLLKFLKYPTFQLILFLVCVVLTISFLEAENKRIAQERNTNYTYPAEKVKCHNNWEC